MIVLPLVFSHLGATTVNRQTASPEEVSWSIQKRERDHLRIDLSHLIAFRSRSKLSFHIFPPGHSPDCFFYRTTTYHHQINKWKPCYPTPGDGINRSIHLKRANLPKHLVGDTPIGGQRVGLHLLPVRPLQRRPKTRQAKIFNDKK